MVERKHELVEVSMCSSLRAELRVTADPYSHLQKQTAAKAARRMDAVLNGAAKACDASQTLRALR